MLRFEWVHLCGEATAHQPCNGVLQQANVDEGLSKLRYIQLISLACTAIVSDLTDQTINPGVWCASALSIATGGVVTLDAQGVRLSIWFSVIRHLELGCHHQLRADRWCASDCLLCRCGHKQI